MKRLSIIIFVFGVISFASCHYEKPGFYEGRDYIQFYYSGNLLHKDSNEVKTSPVNYPYISSTRLRDTAWFRLKAVGTPSSRERQVRFEQYTNEADKNYIEAVPGVNYVAFDDPRMEEYYVIPPHTSSILVPVILLRDPDVDFGSSWSKTFCLHFEIVPNDEVKILDSRFYRGKAKFTQWSW